MPRPSPADPIRDRVKIEEIKTLFREARQIRDYCLFGCGINWGLRISDLLKLRVGDVVNGDGPREEFTVRQKKTRRAVLVPITNHCREALLLFLGERPARGGHPAPHDMSAPLFPSRKRGPEGELAPITRQQADRIIKHACRDVGLRGGNWATHTLRKTWGYHAYRAGTPLSVIQRKLGHRHPAVTLDYLGLTDDDVREWSERIDL